MKPDRILSVFIYTPFGQLLHYAWFRVKLFFVKRNFLIPEKQKTGKVHPIQLSPEESEYIFISGDQFTFLSRTAVFKDRMDWNFSEYGKLWTFHLHSFEYLRQKGLEKDRCQFWIDDFITYLEKDPSSFEPFTASLRIMNWVKFLSLNQVSQKHFDQSVLDQAKKLYYTIEWHLQNNHLLENAFALLYSGVYLGNEKFFRKGKAILETEIEKQILPDGAHFELCPMYHQLMLFRLLECIELLNKNKPGETQFANKITSVASRMLGWMKEMEFENGDMPHVNDSADGIAPTPEAIICYANRLNVPVQKIVLQECGFRKFKTEAYECLVDVGGLEPSANAGHGHADSLSFILYVHNKPFIIDTGLSTYENNDTRQYERSTMAHNTITHANRSQSSLWGAFRVGKRVKLMGVMQGNDYLEASVKMFDETMVHSRRFEFFKDTMLIRDSILGENLETGLSFLYVNKNSEITLSNSKLNSDIAGIEFSGSLQINTEEALAADEFNRQVKCIRLTISFNRSLVTTFTFHNSSKSGK